VAHDFTTQVAATVGAKQSKIKERQNGTHSNWQMKKRRLYGYWQGIE
jgi:hypothetical protein